VARHPRSVDQAIARFDEVVARYDGKSPQSIARRRDIGRTARSMGKRIGAIGLTLAILFVATVVFSQVVAPIGWTGLFVVALLTMCVLVGVSAWPSGAVKRAEYSDQLPTRAVVRQLDSYLSQQRAALPAPAAMRVDAISQQLPLLESRLAEVNPLDPLAQDARRLMGKHLPDLIDRYERVPAAYRMERDGEGLTVDERLVSGLEAARTALDDIGARLTQQDREAFETQGRFIESRYKDGAGFKGE
jgi:hypothetical protein